MKLVKSSSSILRKFLVFNFFIFLLLGSLTFFYLSGIQPNLVKQRMEKHTVIINNTSNHLERLSIEFDKESLKNFLLSTRFLFQNLERVQFYDITGNLIADTNVLDLDKSVFTKTEIVMEEDIKDDNIKKLTDKDNLKNNLNTSSNINSLKEINHYYKNNHQKFTNSPHRKISYFVFNLIASTEDEKSIEKEAKTNFKIAQKICKNAGY